MEILYGPPSVITSPFLVQVYVVGGPPLVSPTRVKVGELDPNDDDWRDICELLVMLPRPKL